MLIAQGMVQVTKKKLNGNVKMVRLPDALRQYWLSKAQQATFLGIHTDTRSELSLGTSRIRRLVDHLDKEDVSFDHIHGDYNTTSTSLPPYYKMRFLLCPLILEKKANQEKTWKLSSSKHIQWLLPRYKFSYNPPDIVWAILDEETPAQIYCENNQPWDLELKPLVSLVNLSYIYLLGRLRNPSIMSQFPYSLIDLTLSASGLVEDPMQSLDKLPNLRIRATGGINVEKGALQALRDLEIRFCRSLKILPAELLHRTLLKIEVIPAQREKVCEKVLVYFVLGFAFHFNVFAIGADIQILMRAVLSCNNL
ncbi:hypothetical protein CK203_057935 [Vitis vinifera]|uniref:Uncharacterized protein n=1 Tax=Vitis vinifera TaxID=29760 RepID=A0A438GMP1_VITVI|nr:hypothetical protein CK203_057935 [Vitis vinifera]